MTRDLADASLRESIDLQSELVDKYFDTVSLGIKTLVSGEYGKVENLLYGMTSVNWHSFEDIGDQSSKYKSAFTLSTLTFCILKIPSSMHSFLSYPSFLHI